MKLLNENEKALKTMVSGNKKQNKKPAMLLIVLTMLVLLAVDVNSLGLSPGKQYVDFESNLTKEMSLLLVNNHQKDMQVVIYAAGENAEFVELSESLIKVKADEKIKIINYKLNLPEEIDEPGEHEIDIVVIEIPDEKSSDEVKVVKSQIALISKVIIQVPYPGKYAEASLHINDAGVGEDVRFVIPVFNLGDKDIVNADAIIDIFGPTNEKLGHAKTQSIRIDTKKQADLKAFWKAEVNPGVYHAIATVNYDNEKIILKKNFNVGTKAIAITDIEANSFRLGDIARFDITIFNNWNEPLPDVYADVEIIDSQGKTNAISKTSTVDLEPFSSAEISSYWDTSKATVGTYKLRVLLQYAGQTTEKTFDIQVFPDSIEIESVTGQVSKAGQNKIKTETVLVSLVMLLILVNIILIFYFTRKKKPPKSGNKTQKTQEFKLETYGSDENNKESTGINNFMLFFIIAIFILFVLHNSLQGIYFHLQGKNIKTSKKSNKKSKVKK